VEFDAEALEEELIDHPREGRGGKHLAAQITDDSWPHDTLRLNTRKNSDGNA
jgi:hypothetical protein